MKFVVLFKGEVILPALDKDTLEERLANSGDNLIYRFAAANASVEVVSIGPFPALPLPDTTEKIE